MRAGWLDIRTHRDSSPRRKACNDDFRLLQGFQSLEETAAHVQYRGGFKGVSRRNMYFATLGTPSWQDVDRRPTRGLSTNPRYPRRRTALFETVKVDVVWAPCIGSSDVTTARRAASWTSCPPQRCVPGCQSDPVSKLSSGQHHLIR